MTDYDKNFVLTSVLNNEILFSWIVTNYYSDTVGKRKEFKIGTCEIKWQLTFEKTYGNNYGTIGFLGVNLGSHRGNLIAEAEYTSSSSLPVKKQVCSCKNFSNQISEHMSITQNIQIKNSNAITSMSNIVFYGKITVLNCDCNQKPNTKRLLEENFVALQDDIHIPLKKKQFSDIVIKVDKTCFPAHKFVLRARSPVFAKMLEHDMKESQDNCITVKDTSKKIMEYFLSFLYSGSLEDDSFTTAVGLYALADKYQVTSLQKTCRGLLISNISESTVMEILNVSDLHTDEKLKEKATEFISSHFSKIGQSAEWSALIDSNTRLASYVLQHTSAKYTKIY